MYHPMYAKDRWPSFPGPDRAKRELLTSKTIWEANSPSGCHGGAWPLSTSAALASTAFAAAVETLWYSDGNLSTSVAHLSSLPAERGLCLREGCVLVLAPLPCDDTLMTSVRACSPPNLLGWHPVASRLLVSCAPSATGARQLRRRSPPTRTSVACSSGGMVIEAERA